MRFRVSIEEWAEHLIKNYDLKCDIGYVYILKSDSGLYKIGKTHNLQARIKTIKTSSPSEIEVERVFKSINCGEAEKELHDRFSAFRKTGEWFQLEQEELDLIESLEDGWWLEACYIS